jgi:glutaredoxin 3
MNVEIYTTPTCGYCHQAKQFLHERGVPFTEYDVDQDRQAAQHMVQLTGQMGVPVLIIDGEIIIGFNRPRIEQLLSVSGRGRGQTVKLGLKVADAVRYTYQDGVYVGAVEDGTPAARAGLQVGDTIVSVDASQIRNAGDMENVMRSVQRGSNLAVVFIRNDKSMQAHIAV